MKKLFLDDLSFNKDVISDLDEVKGGQAVFTSGCTDGCTGSGTFSSSWRCTKSSCTDDCGAPNTSCVCKTIDGS